MHQRFQVVVCGLALMFMLAGCQTVPYEGQAREVKRKPQQEGVISVPVNYRDEDREKAMQKIQSNCAPKSYKILEEGEIAVGQEVKSSAKETDRASTEKQVGKLFGMPIMSGEAGGKNTESSQIVTQVKEWQISYKCVR
ncbi:MAG: hypothetical protein AB7G93_03525 [Bdellovibrionales bacterium]